MKNEKQKPENHVHKNLFKKLISVFLVGAILAAVVAIGVTALLMNIAERRREAEQPFFRVVELTDDTTDPAIWGKNFPLQYDQYKRTVDMKRTRFGGSEAMRRMPTGADPREWVSVSELEEDPRLRVMWAGYPFAEDYRMARGHYYMLEDATLTGRHQAAGQPGTCLNCHSSTYVAHKELGDGDIFKGFEALNKMTFEEARAHVEHPVSCIDCHDSQTMDLRITRPAFIEGIQAYKASQGVPDYDIAQASRQEMRSYVCAQCHVEYYFQGEDRRLVFPWDKGIRAPEMLEYFDEVGFTDWVHADTGAPCLKLQHPEFELWSQGTHAAAGVSCADCHMPYKRVGAMKISDHQVRSPLLNISNSCQTCHRVSEEELLDRAERIQERTAELKDRSLDALMDLIEDIQDALETGATDEQLAEARNFQRRGQFFIDFIVSENSMGFHAPQESASYLTQAIDYIRQGQVALRDARQ